MRNLVTGIEYLSKHSILRHDLVTTRCSNGKAMLVRPAHLLNHLQIFSQYLNQKNSSKMNHRRTTNQAEMCTENNPMHAPIWKSRAPMSYKFLTWLVSKNQCWTADRLHKRGMPHPAACPLCDQEPETLRHLLLRCVVARQVWHVWLSEWKILEWLPQQDT